MTAAAPPVPEVPVLMTKGHVLLGICVLLSAVPVVYVGGHACIHALESYVRSVQQVVGQIGVCMADCACRFIACAWELSRADACVCVCVFAAESISV